MQEYKTISKGKYAQTQSDVPVSITNYVILEEKGKRYLMLKLVNSRNESVSGLRMRLTQLGGDKSTLASEEIELSVGDGTPSADFVLDKKIAVAPTCEDFKAEILSVSYGNYAYSEREGEVCVDYRKKEAKGSTAGARLKAGIRGGKTEVTTKTLKAPALVCVFAVLLLVAISVVTFLQLQLFKRTVTEFKYNDIEYAFVDGENTEDGDIIITGYKGEAKEVKIPDRLELHDVLYVAKDAFRGNKYVEKITFETEMRVEESAFRDCVNLKTVNFDKVIGVGDYAFRNTGITAIDSSVLVEIGQYAFADCAKLAEVKLNAVEGVTLHGYAFTNCNGLEQVRLDTTIRNRGGNTFSDCGSRFDLYLRAFNTQGQKTLLADFLGARSYIGGLEIERLGDMPKSFAEGVHMQSFQANQYDGAFVSDLAFKNCKDLERVDFSKDITGIGEEAFANTGLTSYDFRKVARLGNRAFSGAKLQSVNLNPEASSFAMGLGVFRDCENLRTVTLDIPLTELYEDTFRGCEKLVSVSFAVDSTIKIIGKNAFEECSSLPAITLPSGIEQIGESAFLRCEDLQSVTLPTTLSTVGNQAFRYCTSIANLSLPGSLREIGEYAFASCTALTELALPESVATVGMAAFGSCTSLEKMSLFYTVNGGGGNTFPSFTSLFRNVPNSLKEVTLLGTGEVGENAFLGCSGIEEVRLSAHTTGIGSYAFKNCSALKRMTIPNSVTWVGSAIFQDCNALEELSLPFVGNNGSNQKIGYVFSDSFYANSYLPQSLKRVTVTGEQSIPAESFKDCFYLETVDIRGSVGGIEGSAFYSCAALREVILGEGIRSIGNQAFAACRRLTSVTLPATLQELDSVAFERCYNLYEICNLSGNVTPEGEYLNLCTQLSDKMPTVTTEEGFVFSLKDAGLATARWYMTSYPTSTEDGASIVEYSLPVSFSYEGGMQGSYELPFNLFKENDCIQKVGIPSAVRKIGKEAFYNCENLQEVTFDGGSNFSEIAEFTFAYCQNLKKISLPYYVRTVREGAFYGCSNLMFVELGSQVRTIETSAFEYCERLYVVAEGSNHINVIAGSTDYGHLGYNALFINPAPQWRQIIVHNGIDYLSNGTIWYVLGQNSENYNGEIDLVLDSFFYDGVAASDIRVLSDAFHGNYGIKTVTLGSAVTEMGEEAFSFNGNMTSLSMENSQIREIPSNAFYNCTALESVTLPKNVQSIGDYAFYYANVTEIEFPASLRSIGEKAFRDNDRLTELTLPTGLQSVGYEAFGGCDELRVVTLPSTLTEIGNYAFAYCYQLYEVYNLSRFNVTLGGTSYGRVGEYALAIYTSLGEERRVVENENGLFVKSGSVWRLYKWTGQSVSRYFRLPASFDCYGTMVTAYTIGASALSNYRWSNVIVPRNVTGVEQNGLQSQTVYFEGTQAQWNAISGFSQANAYALYYQVDCVHGSNQWKYDGNNNPDTHIYSSERVAVEATCQNEGTQERYCTVCNYVLSTAIIPKTDHTLAERVAVEPTCQAMGRKETYCTVCNAISGTLDLPRILHKPTGEGKCQFCEIACTAVTEANYESLGITNDSVYPFQFVDGKILSTNKGQNGTSARLTIAATGAMQVAFNATVSSEGNYDKFTVYVNGVEQFNISGEQTKENIIITLQSGDTLTLAYGKDGSVDSGEDCVTITGLIIY